MTDGVSNTEKSTDAQGSGLVLEAVGAGPTKDAVLVVVSGFVEEIADGSVFVTGNAGDDGSFLVVEEMTAVIVGAVTATVGCEVTGDETISPHSSSSSSS